MSTKEAPTEAWSLKADRSDGPQELLGGRQQDTLACEGDQARGGLSGLREWDTTKGGSSGESEGGWGLK